MNNYASNLTSLTFNGVELLNRHDCPPEPPIDSRGVIKQLMRDGEFWSWTASAPTITMPPVAMTGGRRAGKTTRAKAWAEEMRRRGFKVIYP